MMLLTGASGFLGRILYQRFAVGMPVQGLCLSHSCNDLFVPVDLSIPASLSSILDHYHPEIIVHSAAIRDPDACERTPDMARKLHVDATRIMADWCIRANATLVYISTDYVFDGLRSPYREDAAPSPLSVYGSTKAAGESAARAASKHIIMRIPLQYGFCSPQDDSLLLKAIARLKTGADVEIDDRQYRYPTLSDDIAGAMLGLLAAGFNGTIHLRGPTRLTRFALWRAIAEVFGLDPSSVHPAPEPDQHAATRPMDAAIATERYDALNLHRFRDFRTGLAFTRSKMEAAGYDWLA